MAKTIPTSKRPKRTGKKKLDEATDKVAKAVEDGVKAAARGDVAAAKRAGRKVTEALDDMKDAATNAD